ncbi:MAG TPA: lipid II flippase MurJ [Fluviicoccus sp.]|nr:lipid II flippase MurJ [Fluviicoccus sp.]
MLLKSGLVLALGLLLGRVLGFGRELGVAAEFGATGMADAAILTLTFPDLLMNILFGGVLSAVLVPEFVRLGERGSWVLHRRVTVAALAVAVLLAVLIGVFSQPLARVLAPGAGQASATAMAHGLAWSAWLMPLIVCSTVTTVWLQALQRFSASAFSTLFYNALLVAVIWSGLPADDPLRALALTMVAAGVVRSLWLWASVRNDINPAVPEGLDWPGLRRRYADALLTSLALFLFPLVGRAIASHAGDGGLAIYNYATKLVELPLGIAITMVSVVVFSKLAGLIQQSGDWQSLWRDSLRLVAGLAVMITLPAVCFSRQLAEAAFGWGAMSSASLEHIAAQSSVGMLSLGLQGVYVLNNLVLSSFHETRRMMRYSLAGLGVFALGGYAGFAVLGGEGLMLGLVLAYAVMAVLQSRWLAAAGAKAFGNALDARFARMTLWMLAVSIPFWLLSPHVGRWGGLALASVQFMGLAGLAVACQPVLRAVALSRLRGGKT